MCFLNQEERRQFPLFSVSSWRLARNSACPPPVFSFTQSPQCCKRESKPSKNSHLHLEYRYDVDTMPSWIPTCVLVFSPSRKKNWSKTVVSLLDLKNKHLDLENVSLYMTRNTWELKLNSTILTHSKSKLMLIVSILIVNLWIWIIKLHLWYFVAFGVA